MGHQDTVLQKSNSSLPAFIPVVESLVWYLGPHSVIGLIVLNSNLWSISSSPLPVPATFSQYRNHSSLQPCSQALAAFWIMGPALCPGMKLLKNPLIFFFTLSPTLSMCWENLLPHDIFKASRLWRWLCSKYRNSPVDNLMKSQFLLGEGVLAKQSFYFLKIWRHSIFLPECITVRARTFN